MCSNTLLHAGLGQYVGLVFQLVFATTFVVSDLFGTTDCARRDALADSNNKILVVRSREIETKSISTKSSQRNFAAATEACYNQRKLKKTARCFRLRTDSIMKFRLQLIVFCLTLLLRYETTNAEDLTCLKSEVDGTGKPISWYEHLQNDARVALDRRTEKFEQLKSPDQILAYQKTLRELMIQQLGGFPQRSPLNAQVVGQLKRNGYRIEKVIFESQPMHHVTGNLYIPEGKGPFPGVIVSSGHSRTAKTADYNQRFGIILAQNRMVALCYDPIGQGERSQLITADGKIGRAHV